MLTTRLHFNLPPRSPQIGELLEQIADGAITLEAAGKVAVDTGMPEADRQHLLGLVLVIAGYPAEGLQHLENLLGNDEISVVVRTNIAAVWLAYGFQHTAGLQYKELPVGHAAEPSTVALLTEQSDSAMHHQLDARAYLKVRRDALEEAVGRSDSALGGKAALANNYLALAQLGEDLYEPAAVLLEELKESSQDKRPYLDQLLWLYNRNGDQERLEQTMRELSRTDPHSLLLTGLQIPQAAGDEPRGPNDAAPFVSLVHVLMTRCLEKAAAAPAALQDLREVLWRMPRNPVFVHALMLAELASDNPAEASRHARVLEKLPGLSHEHYFNLAQVLWRDGDKDGARRHLQLSYGTASDDAEREDVVELTRALENS